MYIPLRIAFKLTERSSHCETSSSRLVGNIYRFFSRDFYAWGSIIYPLVRNRWFQMDGEKCVGYVWVVCSAHMNWPLSVSQKLYESKINCSFYWERSWQASLIWFLLMLKFCVQHILLAFHDHHTWSLNAVSNLVWTKISSKCAIL